LQNIPQPDDNFWSILKELLAEKEIIEKEKFFEISITVDSTKLFYYVLKKGMFSKMQSLFILIQQILLFQKTTCEKKDIISTSHRIKLILENYCKEIKYSSTSTKIFFENMTPQDDNVLEGYFRNIMKAQTRELVGKSRTYYIKPDIYIYYEVDLENNRLTSLYDEFYNRANTLTEEFLSAVQFNNFILPDTVEILKRFIVSDNSGLIITGVEILAELIELCALARHYDIERTKEARQYLNEMEENLKKYPAPLRQIQFFRMQARVELLEMKYAESLISLRQGYQLSIKYNIPYRACDCCRKFTDIVLKYFVEDKSLLNEALNYTDFAIKYYKTLGKEDHVYFKESLDQRKILIELI